MTLPATLSKRGPRMAFVFLSLLLIQCGGGSGSGPQTTTPDPVVGGLTGPAPAPESAPTPEPAPAPESAPTPKPAPARDSAPPPKPAPAPNSAPPPKPTPEPTGTALLSWVPPAERVDGSSVVLAGFRIYVGSEPGLWDREIQLTNPGLTSYLVEQLAVGTWYFTVTAIDSEGVESEPSEIASKHISG